MARRRKGEPYNPALAAYQAEQAEAEDAKRRDRQATDLLRNAVVAPVTVADPSDGERITVTRSLRDDPLARLHVRDQIDDAQFYAGRDFQKDFELAGRGPQAVDTTREPVDGGKGPEDISEDQYKAAKRLKRVYGALGLDGSALTHMVLVDGQTCSQIARARGYKGERWERFFRDALSGMP
jgi:hypothetical protein